MTSGFEYEFSKDNHLIFTMKNWTKKWTFPLRISLVNVTKSAVVRFTEEIFNGKLHFFCSQRSSLESLLCRRRCFVILTVKLFFLLRPGFDEGELVQFSFSNGWFSVQFTAPNWCSANIWFCRNNSTSSNFTCFEILPLLPLECLSLDLLFEVKLLFFCSAWIYFRFLQLLSVNPEEAVHLIPKLCDAYIRPTTEIHMKMKIQK